MRYLAIDLGDKRTGLAAGDDETHLVSPLGVIEISSVNRREHLARAIIEAAEEHGAGALVIGLPLNMDGTEGDRARIIRAFADELARRADRPVHLQDERLTSFSAEKQLDRTGRTHRQKKQRRDALAAAEILRDFLRAARGNRGDRGDRGDRADDDDALTSES